MDRSDLCGCKGCRTCLVCEKSFGLISSMVTGGTTNSEESFSYCPYCNLAWLVERDNRDDLIKQHPNHNGKSIQFEGVFIKLDFLTEAEETELLKGVDSLPWDQSQSGRRKQNFGPKCNFKKRKLKLGNFNGFPKFTRFVQEKFKEVSLLKDFITIEQCSLEYDPKRGASIDPHVDDCWIWGERIVTVNLLSDSVLTMTYNEKSDRYNLKCVEEYPSRVEGPAGAGKPFPIKQCKKGINNNYPAVKIPMPKRSLLVMYGSARYEWEHRVLRNDITERRVCLAYREFTPPYLPGGERYDKEASEILSRAKQFWD